MHIFFMVLLGILFLVLGCDSKEQVQNKEPLAFPFAEGGGAYTIGGRGGKVIEVTTLNAEGKGSLKEACESSGSRTVVFRVGGTIDLNGKDITISEDNITIAGQTATGDGIQIRNGGLRIHANEVIVRYLRLRSGASTGSQDSLAIGSLDRQGRKKNIIIDHSSIFWAVDENLDAGSFNDNVTVQWSIIAEGLDHSGHKEGRHSRGVMVTENSRNITLHHNLIYRNYKRNPLIQSSDADVVNNVIVNYQYQTYVQPFKGVVRANFIGNYFRSYLHKRPPIRVYNFNRGFDGKSGVYFEDNYDAYYRADSNQSQEDIRVIHSNKQVDNDGSIQDRKRPYDFAKVGREGVHEAYELVLAQAGATYPKRDSVDRRVIASVKSGKAPKTLVNHPKEVGGWAILKGEKSPIDSDHDGMPDGWERSHGLNPHNADDRNGRELSHRGYTNLEVYLNGLVDK